VIPPSLAGQIDRLSRRAHRFYRFAHHPLCSRYASEVIPIGRRIRLCRGCTFVALGIACGLALGIALRGPAILGVGLVLLAATIGWTSIRTRLPKTTSRFLPALFFGIAIACNLVIAAAAIAAAGALLLGYRRRGPDRAPCQLCPEKDSRVCSGFKRMVSRERAFRRVSARWLAQRHVE
jgi:4-amino-4-deoxy-L-arabinose transferase-like glycosyltransferase